MLVPVVDEHMAEQLLAVQDLVLSEVNIKSLELVRDNSVFTRRIKPDFKALGARLGKQMKAVAQALAAFDQVQIAQLEKEGAVDLQLPDGPVRIARQDVTISTDEMPGWIVANEGALAVALDMTIGEDLLAEGLAREFINRVQRLRKEQELDVTDRIAVHIEQQVGITDSLIQFKDYICSELLADVLQVDANLSKPSELQINDARVRVVVQKV
jgi:isoleucyl-tRNA synthetase